MSPAAPDRAFGIDIGGTGIKGGIVSLATGELIGDRFRIDTPQPATPKAVTKTAGQVAAHFDYRGPVGITFPGVVKHGTVLTAANVDPGWVGESLVDLTTPVMPGAVTVLNDADAAGLAEARFGAGRGRDGLVVMVTFGTGIGTALVHDGVLIPNAELGHIEVHGEDAEHRAAASAKDRKGLSWEQWAERADEYLQKLEALLSPELFIVGGGVSKKADKWVPRLHLKTELVVAQMLNNAGIAGAALAAVEGIEKS
ncbi:polyphosphate--glucose phosphotransferase [Nakamurella sp. A5-74]|uniref:Polyphosphate--glucose phosphotransferase n=1 Tax=Nakamurella sp. A5-74 TaxID=3158264 RepID=A0AAU8DJQ2_9ACTN